MLLLQEYCSCCVAEGEVEQRVCASTRGMTIRRPAGAIDRTQPSSSKKMLFSSQQVLIAQVDMGLI